MSKQRYTPEFKDEVVRQVTEKGYSVQEVVAPLGVAIRLSPTWVRWRDPA